MKTYQDNGYQYFFDKSIKSWILYPVNENGNRIESNDDHDFLESEYFTNKNHMIKVYPQLTFTVYSN